jgi:transposase
MLVVETVARIRCEFYVKGKSIKEIVRSLGVSRNTVRKVLRSGETAFAYQRTEQPLLKLGRGHRTSMACWRPTPARRGASA